jgi:hypothetical protein
MCVNLPIVVLTKLISNRLISTRQRTYLTRDGVLGNVQLQKRQIESEPIERQKERIPF